MSTINARCYALYKLGKIEKVPEEKQMELGKIVLKKFMDQTGGKWPGHKQMDKYKVRFYPAFFTPEIDKEILNLTKPVRIQRSRQHKQVSPNGLEIIYVGRPSKFGNPFKVGYKGLTAADCVNLYRIHAKKIPAAELEKLKGKNLSCWCKIGEPCHVDVLLELLNQETLNK
jgi:hypothetical protein